MIKRIVKMEFNPNKIKQFEKIFQATKQHICNFDGCIDLIILQDINKKNIYFTYSTWESQDKLENYKKSKLFYETWAKIKILFNKKPYAYSVKEIL